MELSIVIVNYNVRFFLEHCLHSVSKAIKNIEAEVFVVDNNSVDGSVHMIKEKFPWVRLIESKENLGFSKGNNLALKNVKGKYVLLLNPDTVVEEDTFSKCIAFMNEHPEAGALGVHMIDGKGNFLPESKRSLPTPLVSFYKIFGLSALFPRSGIFSKYHLGYLDEFETNPADILSGAYMFMRKETLDKTGLLDESFFMYGEDIDLSYRIIRAGYKNYYFPGTTIIHYKGESTKKGSVNYVLVFYRAMIIFAKKHFSRKNAGLYSLLINMAVWFRAFLSILKRFGNKLYQPLIDFILIYGGLFFMAPLWEKLMFGTHNYFPPEYLLFVIPSYVVIWLLSLYYSGAYERPVKPLSLVKGHFSGTVFILVLYALLPESLRYSRALLLLGSLWTLFALFIHRAGMNLLGVKSYKFYGSEKKKILIVGEKKEILRVQEILTRTRLSVEIVARVSPSESNDSFFSGSLTQLTEIVSVFKIDEIIFCSGSMSSSTIINNMIKLSSEKLDYKIAPPESISIIGSNSITTSGDLYLIQFNSILKGTNKRQKRLFDILASILIILVSIALIPFKKKFRALSLRAFKVLFLNHTWISYPSGSIQEKLPELKKGIFPLSGLRDNENDEIREKVMLEYARNYKLRYDIELLWKNIREFKA